MNKIRKNTKKTKAKQKEKKHIEKAKRIVRKSSSKELSKSQELFQALSVWILWF